VEDHVRALTSNRQAPRRGAKREPNRNGGGMCKKEETEACLIRSFSRRFFECGAKSFKEKNRGREYRQIKHMRSSLKALERVRTGSEAYNDSRLPNSVDREEF